MKFLFTLLVAAFLHLPSLASTPAEILTEEFDRIQKWILTQTPDGNVGGLYDYVQMDGYLILFSQEFDKDHDTIRFFLNREAPEKDFAITYHYTRHIVRGRTVIRRFIGPEPTGWRNDTIDVNTGEYLGAQGARKLRLKPDEQRIIDHWGLTWIE